MEIADLQMVKTMIAHSQKYFGEDWMWGSPRTGAMRWYVPLWDLALTVTNVEKPKENSRCLVGNSSMVSDMWNMNLLGMNIWWLSTYC